MATSEVEEGKAQSLNYCIGYALAPKKVQSFIQPSLINFAAERGLHLIQIDPQKPLIEQGPFDCIVHKLSGPEWAAQLDQYSAANPTVPIIDPLPAIDRLHNRISMLDVVHGLDISGSISLGIPRQVFVEIPQQIFAVEDLKFPVIAKPVVADGSADSHRMYLVFNKRGLEELQPPIVLQEFVNHGGVIFKVYVAGDHVQCVKRKSLPDISEDKLKTFTSQNVLPFSQISNHAAKENDGDADDDDDDNRMSKLIDEAKIPPSSFVNELANALRDALGLRLFNFDLIRDAGNENKFLVIDINYFPGYAKMPSYEAVLTEFLLDVLRKRKMVLENED